MNYDPLFWERFFWLIKYMDSVSLTNIIHEIIVFSLTALMIYHGYKKYGLVKTLIFFSGGFLFAGLEENEMILAGYEMKGLTIFGTEVPMTYYFNYHGYILWFMAVPIIVACAWYILTYASVQITQKVVKGFVKSALLGAFIGMSMDLMIDPIMIRRYNWIWLADLDSAFWILQVPISNFVGWFLLIFAFNWVFYWYYDKFLAKRENWGTFKRSVVFYMFMYGILILVEFVTIGITLAFSPLYGIDISWWPWPS
ncbi:MAG: carotenoid biosynthesis protein [Candidatus Helarchaeota archaeon]